MTTETPTTDAISPAAPETHGEADATTPSRSRSLPPSGSSFAGAEVFVGALGLFGALAWLNLASLRTLEQAPRAAGPFLLVFGGLATMVVLRLRREGGGAPAIIAALGLALVGRSLAPGWSPLLISTAPLLADALWAHLLRDAIAERRDRAGLACLQTPDVSDEAILAVASRLSPERFPELVEALAERREDASLLRRLETLPPARRGLLGGLLGGHRGLRMMRLALAEMPELELTPSGAVDPAAEVERAELEQLVALDGPGSRLAIAALLGQARSGWNGLLPRLSDQAAAQLGGEPEQATVAAELFQALPEIEREAGLDRLRAGAGPDRATLLGLLSAAPRVVAPARLVAAAEVLDDDDPHAIETLLVALELRTNPESEPPGEPEMLAPGLIERLRRAAARIREHHPEGDNPVADSFVARMLSLAEAGAPGEAPGTSQAQGDAPAEAATDLESGDDSGDESEDESDSVGEDESRKPESGATASQV